MKSIAFYSRAFYTGGMENAVYNMCLLLNKEYKISILFKESNEKTEKMLSKLATVAKIEYVGNELEFDVLINCDRKDFLLPNIKAKKTIHWFSSCLVENIPNIQGKIITQSKWHYEQLKKLGLESTIIGNPLDVDNILYKSFGEVEQIRKNDEIVYMIVARISNEKGFDRAIQFMAKRRTENSRLFVIGGSTMPHSDLLKRKVQLALKNKVVFLGEKDNPYPYMKQADYILCLSDNEIYGLVAEEAHILGKQVIFNRYPTANDQFIPNFDMWYDSEIKKQKQNYNISLYGIDNVIRLKKWKEIIDE